MPPARALALLEPMLLALAEAHRCGLVHRDVKPENVLIADDGRVKVADFGLARAFDANTTHTATGGLLIGTVSYLAPELIVNGKADPRSDVYAAGVLLYEMLTGRKPHEGEGADPDRLQARQRGRPPALGGARRPHPAVRRRAGAPAHRAGPGAPAGRREGASSTRCAGSAPPSRPATPTTPSSPPTCCRCCSPVAAGHRLRRRDAAGRETHAWARRPRGGRAGEPTTGVLDAPRRRPPQRLAGRPTRSPRRATAGAAGAAPAGVRQPAGPARAAARRSPRPGPRASGAQPASAPASRDGRSRRALPGAAPCCCSCCRAAHVAVGATPAGGSASAATPRRPASSTCRSAAATEKVEDAGSSSRSPSEEFSETVPAGLGHQHRPRGRVADRRGRHRRGRRLPGAGALRRARSSAASRSPRSRRCSRTATSSLGDGHRGVQRDGPGGPSSSPRRPRRAPSCATDASVDVLGQQGPASRSRSPTSPARTPSAPRSGSPSSASRSSVTEENSDDVDEGDGHLPGPRRRQGLPRAT